MPHASAKTAGARTGRCSAKPDDGRGTCISVLSGRADLVSGGDALISIRGLRSARGLSVQAGGKDQTSAFTRGRNGTAVGLVSGLPLGQSSVIVRAGRRGAKLRVTNHPIGGPVFSGPQLQPWKCQADGGRRAVQPAARRSSYVYKSSNPAKPGFLPYDPANAPADVAPTTTDKGVSVPFIVRLETGYIDRDQYQIAALFQPAKSWTPVAPQRQFNHKLLVTHGFGCGADHQTGTVPSVLAARPRPRSRAASRPWPTCSTTPATTATSQPRPSRS